MPSKTIVRKPAVQMQMEATFTQKRQPIQSIQSVKRAKSVKWLKKPDKAITGKAITGRGYQIYNASSEEMVHIPDNNVSLVLTDPPYFIDGMDNRWDNRKLQRRVKKGVVGGIPAGQKFDPAQGVNLQKFLQVVAKECFRVLKPGGFMLCFSQARLVHRTASALEYVGFEIRDMIAWQYEGQPKAFSQDHFVRKMNIPEKEKRELINQLGGRKTPQLKPRMELIVLAQKPKQGTFIENWLHYRTGLIDVQNPLIEPDGFPATIIPCKKPKEKHGHMTVKPIDLCRHLIRIFSVTNDTVLDPFMGTGTTALAALTEKRKCIGYEIDSDMIEIITKRIKSI
ncbi:methyltransferase [Spirochaetota bacterium]|nr:methyltransferase [Spirochaetota bacterium]